MWWRLLRAVISALNTNSDSDVPSLISDDPEESTSYSEDVESSEENDDDHYVGDVADFDGGDDARWDSWKKKKDFPEYNLTYKC